MSAYKSIAMFTMVGILAGCAGQGAKPYVDTSDHSQPVAGKAGIYFYQWKTGLLGAAWEGPFKLDGEVLSEINTGEWDYFEVEPGVRRYHMGWLQDPEMLFEPDKNYFFRGFVNMASSHVIPIHDEREIRETLVNIESGRYEHADVD